jgi:hypothetical protein
LPLVKSHKLLSLAVTKALGLSGDEAPLNKPAVDHGTLASSPVPPYPEAPEAVVLAPTMNPFANASPLEGTLEAVSATDLDVVWLVVAENTVDVEPAKAGEF